jgi:hypothetical protein
MMFSYIKGIVAQHLYFCKVYTIKSFVLEYTLRASIFVSSFLCSIPAYSDIAWVRS